MKIYVLYETEKLSQGLIDLNDLIILATKTANEKKFPYKYIFIDEFQDTSQIRFDLIYTIFKNSNALINLFGDDFQSIYAFSGCKLEIMLNITQYIPRLKIIALENNYRLSNDLIKLSTNFILKNKKQINKNIKSTINNSNTLNIIYYSNFIKTFNTLIKKVEFISNDIMILGRYKHDFNNIKTNYRMLTIHEAKGLEADIIIIINLKDDYYGFPSKIQNHFLLNCLYKNQENYLYAEERRLFYVALTRAKKKVYLLVPYGNPSIFIKEIK